jgi:AraC-like DNA-binding protein
VVPAGCAGWIPAKTRCALEPSGRTQVDVLYLEPLLVRRAGMRCDVLEVGPLLKAIVDHVVEIESLPANAAGRRLAGVLADQLASARSLDLRLPSPQRPRAMQVAQLLMTDPSDTLSLAVLGKTVALSARTLARDFLGDTGVTLGRWRRQFRLTHALTLIAEGRPVKDVALEVGYETPSAFVAAFKRALGTTPARLFKRG